MHIHSHKVDKMFHNTGQARGTGLEGRRWLEVVSGTCVWRGGYVW